ncbi:hypothetical protein ACFLZ6_01980 [Nanoarchaeota archaeon]
MTDVYRYPESENHYSTVGMVLERIGPPAVPFLINALGKRGYNHGAVAYRLQNIGKEHGVEHILPAVKPLVELIRGPRYYGARDYVESTLRSIGEPAAIALVDALKSRRYRDNHIEIRSALDEIGKPAVRPMVDLLVDGRYSSAHVVVEMALTAMTMGADAVVPLVEALKDPKNKESITRISLILSSISKDAKGSELAPAIPILRGIIESDEKDAYYSAALTLGYAHRKIGEPRQGDIYSSIADRHREKQPEVRHVPKMLEDEYFMSVIEDLHPHQAVSILFSTIRHMERRGMNLEDSGDIKLALDAILRLRARIAEHIILGEETEAFIPITHEEKWTDGTDRFDEEELVDIAKSAGVKPEAMVRGLNLNIASKASFISPLSSRFIPLLSICLIVENNIETA